MSTTMIARILGRWHCHRTGHRGAVLPSFESGGWDFCCVDCKREWVIVR